jgi:hypothetical protein
MISYELETPQEKNNDDTLMGETWWVPWSGGFGHEGAPSCRAAIHNSKEKNVRTNKQTKKKEREKK